MELEPNKENIRKWVKALRSGDYKQVKGMLHRADTTHRSGGYCCLGVACELAVNDGVPVERTKDNILAAFRYDNSDTSLPLAVRKWLGVDSHNPTLLGDRTAAGLNDTGHEFTEIADAIEKEYL